MKSMSFVIAALLVLCSETLSQPDRFRSGIFLHHSTGACIWGPNGSTTSVPQEIAAYNSAHALSGADSVSLDESGWPVTPWDNEWYRWHRIFDGQDTDAVIAPILAGNKIVVIKSCFPSSGMEGAGSAEDTLNDTYKTVSNYKWHWRSFIRVMEQHPENFFVVWTNAPLVADATNDEQAASSDRFCRWAADTLARGIDPVFGPFPRNVCVFDFYRKLVGADGKLPATYASSSSDSHPNDAATALVAPQFVTEVFDAALQYESFLTGVGAAVEVPSEVRLLNNYPNPFNPRTTIEYTTSGRTHVTLKVLDLFGREVAILADGTEYAGRHSVSWNGDRCSSGIYFVRLQAAGQMQTRRMVLLK